MTPFEIGFGVVAGALTLFVLAAIPGVWRAHRRHQQWVRTHQQILQLSQTFRQLGENAALATSVFSKFADALRTALTNINKEKP